MSFSITSAGNAPVRVRAHTALRGERIDVAQFAIVPDLDMAGARGAAIAARTIVLGD
jgi:glucokinase